MTMIIDGTSGITFPDNTLQATAGGPGFKNRIINGAMMIDQRNAGASVTGNNGVYTLDRFFCYASQSSKYTVQQNAGSVTPPSGFKNYLGVTSSSAYSVTSTDYFAIAQGIEGYNIADFAWGTASAVPITISFWVRSSLTGTFGGYLSGGQIYPFSYTINSANTWEQKSITIAGSTSGTWVTSNAAGVYVGFCLGAGSTYLGTAGSWGSTNYFGPTGQTSVVGTNGATFYITGVQLEKGSTATSFDYRPYQSELALCQRYFEKVGFGDSNSRYPGVVAYAAAAGEYTLIGVSFVVAKRAIPTLVAGTTNNSNISSSDMDGQSTQGFRFGCTAAGGGSYATSYSTSGVTASAEL